MHRFGNPSAACSDQSATRLRSASSEALLNSDGMREADCLIVDMRMTGLSGLELQKRLIDMSCSIPIIFVTADADDELNARAFKQGAIALLGKPFHDQTLLRANHSALKSAKR
jgi:FixJ family two-component response regulator